MSRQATLPQREPGGPALAGGALAVAMARLAERLANPDARGLDELLPEPARGPLADVAAAFALTPLDLNLLCVAAAAALDERIAALYATHASQSGGWPSVGLALRLLGREPDDAETRLRLSPGNPLVEFALMRVEGEHLPLPQRQLRVADRVVSHLLEADMCDPTVAPLLAPLVPMPGSAADDIARGLGANGWVQWVQESPRASGFAAAAAALDQLGAAGIAVDLRRLPDASGLGEVLTPALREAALRHAALVVGPVDPQRDRGALLRLTDPPCPVLLVSRQQWDPHAQDLVPLLVHVGEPSGGRRLAVWRNVLAQLGREVTVPNGLADYRLTAEQIAAAAASAVVQAGERPLLPEDLAAAARAHNAGALERLVRRVTPRAGFDSLVLAPTQLADVVEVINRYRTIELVRGTWGVGGAHTSRGVTALFHGLSGTGKTLSAEVIAHELGVDLFVIDLSQVVDKYIGETEKNLERIFSSAENVNGVLFFDEADALFGKRSDVKDAHDRHANVEVAYLLERMERFDGVAVLATNLRGNIDEAFLRRLDVVCDFQAPTEEERRRLWRLHLPATLPQAEDIDVDLLARALDVPGGIIRNITLAAAHAAAGQARAVAMQDLVLAASTHYRKSGRRLDSPELELLLPSESRTARRHERG